MNNKFTEREKGFEKKFAKDEELQFKVQARSNKYLAEFVSKKLGKTKEDEIKYVQEIIKADMKRLAAKMFLEKLKKIFKKLQSV